MADRNHQTSFQQKMTFEQLLKTWDWRPIHNCPGRYTLRGAKSHLPPEELLGAAIEVSTFQVPGAKDAVLVVPLNQGGLISYKRTDGSFLHTLNTPEGFRRKLLQLGITVLSE